MMKPVILFALALLISTAGAQDHQHGTPAPQPPAQKQEQHHHHGPAPAPPQAAPSQEEAAAPAVSLEHLLQLAERHNPTLRQAKAEITAARARRRQAGLLPNPVVGYTGEEIRGGVQRGGQHGFFVEQTVPLGGKLASNRRVVEQEILQAEAEAEEQRMRVVNGVKMAYYDALGAQEMLATQRALAKLARDAVVTTRQLFNVGQADETDVLQSEIEADQAEIAVENAVRNRQRIWTQLASVAGQPAMPLADVQGQLDRDLPQINEAEMLARLAEASPAARIAQTGIARAEAQVQSARRENFPDLHLRGGLQQNREWAESSTRPIGAQGFAEIGVTLPIFNRNQGGVAAAQAEVERARAEAERVRLLLRERGAALLQAYQDSRSAVERYRTRMLPRAQRAYELMQARHGEMAASYPQVLVAQRTLFHLRGEYVRSLARLWGSAIALEGFMLTDALEAPARPAEMDNPVREINLPSQREIGSE